MEYERGTKMKTQCKDSDIITTLPENIIETILSLMPIRDALRTSVLSKKWRYRWQGMPKLVFTDDMVKLPSDCVCAELEKYKIANAIFHVLLLHHGPTVLEFNCSVGELEMDSEFAQIFSYLSRGDNVKKLIFHSDQSSYELPIYFFSLQGLEFLHLEYSTFKPPLTFNGFSRLKSMTFWNVTVSAQMLHRFLSKCPLLEHICLSGDEIVDLAPEGNKFTYVDLLRCVPLIENLDISKYYMKYLSSTGIPHKLPTSLAHLKHLNLEVCLMEQNEISSALCIIRSSPVLESIIILMYDNEKLPGQQTPQNSLDLENHLDLKLDHLEVLEFVWFSTLPLEIEFVKLIMAKSPMLKKIQIHGAVEQTPTKFLESKAHSAFKLDHLEILKIEGFCNLPLEMEFVKLILTNSPVLKKVQIKLPYSVSVDEEVKMLRDLVRLPLPRASPSAELIIKRR